MAFGTQKKPKLVTADEALPDRTELVVVGGGVIGLAIAYNLARRGFKDVVILERGPVSPPTTAARPSRRPRRG